MDLIASGLSFRTAPIAVRERAAIGEAQARTTLRFLVGHSGLSEAAVLSTCNRTEFYLVAPRPGLGGDVADRLARYLDPGRMHGVGEHMVTRTGAEAMEHMFRVAAGLDSMVLGEVQILGQFKAAHRLARQAGTLDHTLDFVMQRAIGVGKRVRTQTGLGRGVASIGELATRWARGTIGGLEGRGALVIGAGEVAGLVARRLSREGVLLHVSSRGGASAERLAGRLGGVAVPADRIDEVGSAVDLVVTSTTDSGYVLRTGDVERFQAIRHSRPLAILDIAVPRDVEPDAHLVPGVTLCDLDALGPLVDEAMTSRRAHLPAADAIVDDEVRATVALVAERGATAPTIAALVRRAEEVRRAEVERTAGRLDGLDTASREAIDTLTRSLVRKLLHAPISHLRAQGDDPAAALLLRQVFDLDAAGGAPPSPDG